MELIQLGPERGGIERSGEIALTLKIVTDGGQQLGDNCNMSWGSIDVAYRDAENARVLKKNKDGTWKNDYVQQALTGPFAIITVFKCPETHELYQDLVGPITDTVREDVHYNGALHLYVEDLQIDLRVQVNNHIAVGCSDMLARLKSASMPSSGVSKSECQIWSEADITAGDWGALDGAQKWNNERMIAASRARLPDEPVGEDANATGLVALWSVIVNEPERPRAHLRPKAPPTAIEQLHLRNFQKSRMWGLNTSCRDKVRVDLNEELPPRQQLDAHWNRKLQVDSWKDSTMSDLSQTDEVCYAWTESTSVKGWCVTKSMAVQASPIADQNKLAVLRSSGVMHPVPHGLHDLAGHGVFHIESLAQEHCLVKLLSACDTIVLLCHRPKDRAGCPRESSPCIRACIRSRHGRRSCCCMWPGCPREYMYPGCPRESSPCMHGRPRGRPHSARPPGRTCRIPLHGCWPLAIYNCTGSTPYVFEYRYSTAVRYAAAEQPPLSIEHL
eukprot:COSAG01_NODE_5110_length_4475_cov_3.906764_7_plen_501_part_00